MLISIAKKVLKSIIYLCKNNETTSNLDIIVYLHNKTNDLDLHNTLLYLRDERYITGDSNDGLWENIKPTYKGKHYFKFKYEEFKNFLLKSFIIPILVSLLTSLLTLWLIAP